MSEILDRLREKYPAYNDISDEELIVGLGQKYPQYLDADPSFKDRFEKITKSTTPVVPAFRPSREIAPEPSIGPESIYTPERDQSLTEAMNFLNRTHPEFQQGPPMPQAESLAPALPTPPAPELRPPPQSIGPLQPKPTDIEAALGRVGEPIEARPGIDFPALKKPGMFESVLPMPELTTEQVQSFPIVAPTGGIAGHIPKSIAGLSAGAQNMAAGIYNFMSSPAGIATVLTQGVAGEALAGGRLAGSIAGEALQAGEGSQAAELWGQMARNVGRTGKAMETGMMGAFAADMTRHLPQQTLDVLDALERGDTREATAGILNAMLTLTAITGVSYHATTAAERKLYASQERQRTESGIGEYQGASAQRLPTEAGSRNRPVPIPTQRPQAANVPQITDAEYLAAERQAIEEADKLGSPVQIVDTFTDEENAPFNNRFIARAFKHGIEINRAAFRQWLSETPPERRAEAVKSVMSEEHIHRHVNDADAKAYWDTLTGLEKAAETYQYTGFRSLDRANQELGVDLNPTDLGHEAVRRRLQKLYRSTPTEVAESALKERWTLKTVDALSTLIRKARETMGTEAARRGEGIVMEAQRKLDLARSAIVAKQTADDNGWQLDTTPQVGAFQIPSDLSGYSPEDQAKLRALQAAQPRQWAFTDPKTGTTVYTREGATKEQIEATLKAKEKAPAALRRQRPEDKTPPLPLLAGATREERATAAELGAEPLTPEKIAAVGYQHLQSETDRITEAYQKNPDAPIKPPSFDRYVGEMKRRFGDLQPGQLYESFSDNLYKRLFNASGQTLEALQRSLGIKVKGRIADPAARPGFLKQEGATPEARAQMRSEARAQTSSQRYRIGAIRLIHDKLTESAKDEAAARATRTEVTPDDVYGMGTTPRQKQTQQPVFWDIGAEYLKNPQVLGERLTADSRRFNRDPVSLTKRLTALLDSQSNKVYLVSTYPHGRTGAMLVDPGVSAIRAHKPLTQILQRYRPIASVLLDEPVRGFRQEFKSVGAFERDFATSARKASETISEPPLTEGEAEVPGTRDVDVPMTDREAGSILDHIERESGTFDSPEDVKASLSVLGEDLARSQRLGRIEDTARTAISGYRKLFAALEKKYPTLSYEDLLDKLSKQLYENNLAGRTLKEGSYETFVGRTMAQAGARYRGDVERETGLQPTDVPAGQELTLPIERRPPTDIRPENIPAEAAAQLRTKPAPPVPEGTLTPATSKPPAALRRRLPQSLQDDVEATGQFLRDLGAERGIKGWMARLADDMFNLPNIRARDVEMGIRLKSKPGKASALERITAFTGDKNVLGAAKALVSSGALRTVGTIDVAHAQNSLQIFHGLVDAGIADAKQMLATGSLFTRRAGRIKLRTAEQLKAELNYAESHLNDKSLINTAHRTRQELGNLFGAIKASGRPINFKDNYLPGRYDLSGTDGRVIIMQEPRIIGAKFQEPKVFNNYYEAIAVPGKVYVPATLDVASLVGSAVRRGLSIIQKDKTEEILKGMQAPDGLPLAVDATSRGGPGAQLTPPAGYAGYEIVGGLAVHPHFAATWRLLTAPSYIEETAGLRHLLHFTQGIKHALLVGDLFHLGRITYYAASLMRGNFGFKGGWSALEFQDRDIGTAVSKGLISQAQADWGRTLIKFGNEQITRRELLRRATSGGVGFNIGRIQDALYKDVYTQLTPTSGPIRRAFARITDPTTGRYNRFLFDKYTRGLMAEALVNEFERQSALLEKRHTNIVQGERVESYDPNALLKDISRDLNNYFGNIGRQGAFKSRTAQDLARLFFLAPQWVEGLVKKEAVGASRLTGLSTLTGQRTGLTKLGATGTGMATGLAFMFGLAQTINFITRGKPTWSNEEENHKMDAWLPVGGENGMWFSPFSLFAEISHDLWRLSHTKPTFMNALDQVAGNKESPLTRAVLILTQGFAPTGQKYMRSMEQVKAAGQALVPVPLTFGKLGQVALHKVIPSVVPPVPAQALTRQLFQATGIKLEPGETAYQRMSSLARNFMETNNYRKDTGWVQVMTEEPSYSKLRQQVRDGDEAAAKRTFEFLHQNRSTSDILKAMHNWSIHPLTGSSEREKQFIQGLSDKELNTYTKAQEERFQSYNAFVDFLVRNNL